MKNEFVLRIVLLYSVIMPKPVENLLENFRRLIEEHSVTSSLCFI